MIQICGLYTIKDEYFYKFDPAHVMMDNKKQCRPYYCGVRADTGILWLIPLSSKVEKYSAAIERQEKKHGKGNCIYYYIAKLKGRKNAFLIGNAIPCTERYILKPFTLGGVPFIIKDQQDIKALKNRLSRFIALVRTGVIHPNADILSIEQALLKE